MIKRVKCEVVVEVDTAKIKKLGYDSIEDYLNECSFQVIDDTDEDIEFEVRDYEVINMK